MQQRQKVYGRNHVYSVIAYLEQKSDSLCSMSLKGEQSEDLYETIIVTFQNFKTMMYGSPQNKRDTKQAIVSSVDYISWYNSQIGA